MGPQDRVAELVGALDRGEAPAMTWAIAIPDDAALAAAWAECREPRAMLALLEHVGRLDPRRAIEALAGVRLDVRNHGDATFDADGAFVRVRLTDGQRV
jgi:hypothetical protein